MRLIISAALLLASTAAMPAFAQDNPPHHDGGHRDGGGQRGNGGGQARPGPSGGNYNRGPQGGPPPVQAQAQVQAQARPGPQDGGQGRHFGAQASGGVQVWRDRNRPGSNDQGPDDQGGRPAWANHPFAHGGEGGYRAPPPPPNGQYGGNYGRGGPGGGGGWNRGWRGDRRYDWQGWRDGHRDFYHVGRYQPPGGYGWGYRRFGIGFELEAGFFAQQYWIGDPGYYRLPPAYGPYRWVRYYNDALLVNIYNGYIVDEIPDFFW